jgi:hypothetical protein
MFEKTPFHFFLMMFLKKLTSLIDAEHLFLDSICRYFQNLKKEGIAPLNPIPLLRTQSNYNNNIYIFLLIRYHENFFYTNKTLLYFFFFLVFVFNKNFH